MLEFSGAEQEEAKRLLIEIDHLSQKNALV